MARKSLEKIICVRAKYSIVLLAEAHQMIDEIKLSIDGEIDLEKAVRQPEQGAM